MNACYPVRPRSRDVGIGVLRPHSSRLLSYSPHFNKMNGKQRRNASVTFQLPTEIFRREERLLCVSGTRIQNAKQVIFVLRTPTLSGYFHTNIFYN